MASPAAAGDPWPEGPVLNLKNRVFPSALGVTGEPLVPAELQQILPEDRALLHVRDEVPFVAGLRVLQAGARG
jgi:hypothetical protein